MIAWQPFTSCAREHELSDSYSVRARPATPVARLPPGRNRTSSRDRAGTIVRPCVHQFHAPGEQCGACVGCRGLVWQLVRGATGVRCVPCPSSYGLQERSKQPPHGQPRPTSRRSLRPCAPQPGLKTPARAASASRARRSAMNVGTSAKASAA